VTTSATNGMQSNGVIIEGNSIWNFGYLNLAFGGRSVSGIQYEPQTADGIAGGIVRNNEIHNGMATHPQLEDGIKVSAAGFSPVTGLVIVNNSISNVGGPGINLSENAAPVVLRNNAMTSCSTKGLACNGNARCDLWVDASPHMHSHNTYWSANAGDIVVKGGGGVEYTRSDAASYETTAVQSDPQFTSATSLKLLQGSALIDAGTDVDCPASDHDGVHRPMGARCDVGAFEFGGDSTPRRPAAPKNPRIIRR
jgi:hypothetical protein